MSYAAKHRVEKPRRHLLRAVTMSMVVVLTALAGGGVMVYRYLDSNIVGAEIDIDGPRPEEPKLDLKPMNILLLGSDSRAGQSAVLGSTSGLSDTTILLHVSGDRKRAYGVSIPRDLMVDRPDCKSKDGKSTVPGGLSQFNAAFPLGGPSCTIKTVEKMTDIRIHHYAVIDFNGFKAMVDALDGVPVCVPNAVDDSYHQVHLKEGEYEVKGNQALTYVRARYGIGNGSDVGRIKRQQAFLAAMTNKAVSAGTLVNPVRLFRFLDAATKSLTTDPGLASLNKLRSLAGQLQDVGLDKIQFVTVPITTYEPDPNRLALGEGADRLWDALRNDQPIPKDLRKDATRASDAKPGSASTPGTDGATSGPTSGSTSGPTGTTNAADEAEAEANGLCA